MTTWLIDLSPPPAASWDEFKPTQEQINSACMSYRHDFGLLDATGQQTMRWMATEWLRAWQKEIKALRATPAATKSADAGGVQSEYERGFEAGRKSWGTIIEQHKAYTAELENILSHQPAPVAANASAEAKNYLYWAVGRWNAEVLSRPLQNIHRRSFDAAWRQVIRHFGGDDRELCGPTHDELLDGAHPHASDCDKQERELTKREQYCIAAALLASGTVVDETTKSEGGTEGRARSTKADSVRGEAGSAPSQDGSLAQLAAGIDSGPSDRTVDVTWGELHAFILKHSDEWEDEGVAARALLDAFTVGRR